MSKYAYWLSNIKGIGAHKISLFRKKGYMSADIYHMGERQLKKLDFLKEKDVDSILESRKTWNLEKEWQNILEQGIGFVSREDASYPAKLSGIPQAPYSLYYIGRLPDEDKKQVAIVGARTRSAYGSRIADELAKTLAANGVDVVSGLANGIDSDGHRGALDGGGDTYAVLGCGINICYPKSNQYLYDKIISHGGIISEYPPQTPVHAAYFPQRNRIISGLSDYTVVVEARLKSGSLITADFALEQGREVYAFPGRVTDSLSQGCNRLIAQGAGVITGVGDFLKEMQLDTTNIPRQINFNKNLLEKDERLVYSLFDFCPVGLGTLVEKTGYTLPEVLSIMERLEQKGFVKEIFANFYVNTV